MHLTSSKLQYNSNFINFRYFTCTLEALKSYNWQPLAPRCWFVAKHFCLSHSLYHVKKNAMIFIWHCKSYTSQVKFMRGEEKGKRNPHLFFNNVKCFCIFQFILQICIAFNTHQAMKSCPKPPDGISFRWRVNSSVNMYQMIVGHCAI